MVGIDEMTQFNQLFHELRMILVGFELTIAMEWTMNVAQSKDLRLFVVREPLTIDLWEGGFV